jgi:hypothetical protein
MVTEIQDHAVPCPQRHGHAKTVKDTHAPSLERRGIGLKADRRHGASFSMVQFSLIAARLLGKGRIF